MSAAQTLAAAQAAPVVLAEFLREGNFPDESWRVGVAIDTYRMADAMLAERDK